MRSRDRRRAPGPPEQSGRWTIADLVALPVLALPDPATRIDTDLRVPESARFCRTCAAKVGRGYAGQPALSEGYCPRCGTPFSFSPRLRPGDLVAGQYRVVGALARGGMGWVYLAADTHLHDNHVVLKGLINTSDPVAVDLAVAERRFLTAFDHPNIVRIITFVQHRDRGTGERTGYIVMEYLNGLTLREIRQAAAEHRDGAQLPLEHVLGYGHEILAALDYLHRNNVLYCDMKPDNVIRCADRIKVIDIGGVRRMDDRHSPYVGTRGFDVSAEEKAGRGLTVQSDIHTVGRTLEELFGARTGDPDDDPAGFAVRSFHRLVARATDRDPDRRFATAQEMSEQLKGVLREVVALRRRREDPEVSAVFAPTPALLDGGPDGGLGAVPPLTLWTSGQATGPLHTGRPRPAAVATGLPVPRVDPHDPAAAFLATLDAPDPRSLLSKLVDQRGASVEVELARCRAYLEVADTAAAVARLVAAERILGHRAPHDWRLSWHRGLIALAGNDPAAARRHFDEVYAACPGEAAPKLALGYCAEARGDVAGAAGWYDVVWRRDSGQTSAAFGLARTRLAGGDRRAAVAILDQVPRVSRHYDAARVAAVRILSGALPCGPPAAADLNEAVRRLRLLHLDGGAQDGEARQRLTAVVRGAALRWFTAGRAGPGRLVGDGVVLADPPSETDTRVRLEQSLRGLATRARSAHDHGVLVDLANAVRPKTLW